MELPPLEIWKLAKTLTEFEGGDTTLLKFLLKEISKEEYVKWAKQKKKEVE